MFISKKSFTQLLNFLEQARANNKEIARLVKEVEQQLKEKNSIIDKYRKVVLQSSWITIHCPKCDHQIDVHTQSVKD